MDKAAEAMEILKQYDQEHVIDLLNKLDQEKRQELLEQINKIDFHQIMELYDNTKKEIEIKREHYRLLTPYDNYYKNLLQVYSSTCTEQFTEQFADQEMTGYWWSLTNIQLEEER